jgi:nicotinamide mononucleotide transporter
LLLADSLSDLLSPLNHQLFMLGQDAVTPAELLGFVTGAVAVWLCVKAHIWNFPVGIANNLFFLVLFWSARLYADAALQVVFLLLASHGWYRWLRGGTSRTERPMGRATPVTLVVVTLLLVPATAILTMVLTKADDSAPFWDALTTALSLAAQWLLNAKQLENWHYWIVADLIYIPLYSIKHLVLTAVVYVIFLAMCGIGFRAWQRELRPIGEPVPA